MNREQVKKLFKRIKANYDNFSANEGKLNEWCNMLQDYAENGVNNALDQYLKEGKQEAPMCVNLISEFYRVKTLKKYLKCKYCEELFDEEGLDQLLIHEDRCRSIKYILKRTKELWNKDIDKKVLYNMNDSEFESKYELFLKKVMETTLNREEKLRINCIFNPPNTKEKKCK